MPTEERKEVALNASAVGKPQREPPITVFALKAIENMDQVTGREIQLGKRAPA
jgi:hypothetical protein